MFISQSLCLFPSHLDIFDRRKFSEAGKLVFPNGCTGVKDRQEEVTTFLCATEQYEDRQKGVTTFLRAIEQYDEDDEDENASQALVHAPMHDAESIFWLIVLFFLRACPKDYNPKSDPDEPKRRRLRTSTFESLVKNTIGTVQDTRGAPSKAALPPQLHCFVDMLKRLKRYFSQAWHHLQIDEERHRFHAHNALQSVLLQEIQKLQARNMEIEINLTPLGVDDNPALIPRSQSYVGTKGNVDGPPKAKKQKVKHDGGKADNNLEATSDGSVPTRLMTALDGDRRSKLWFMGDRDYIEYMFVEGEPAEEQEIGRILNENMT